MHLRLFEVQQMACLHEVLRTWSECIESHVLSLIAVNCAHLNSEHMSCSCCVLDQVVNGEEEFGWGAVVNFQKRANQSKVSAKRCN